jgi:hypothetical protein
LHPNGALSEEALDDFHLSNPPLEPSPREFLGVTVLERRLTADGLDLVRAGAVPAKAFLAEWVGHGTLPYMGGWEWKPEVSLPAGLLADAEFAEFAAYAPSRYAVCRLDGADASRALRRLPAPTRALLRGKERTYHVPAVGGPYGPQIQDVECFEVSEDEVSVLAGTLAGVGFEAWPLLPHGEPAWPMGG